MSIKRNLDEIIQNNLYSEIVQGKWSPGLNLSVDEIMEEYGVSRTPVIQALKKMNGVGVVDFSKEGHFIVPEYSLKQVKDILDVRRLLEHYALNEVENEHLKIDFEQLDILCQKGIESIEKGDVIETRLSDLEFHRLLIAQADNECLSESYRRVQSKFMIANYLIGRHTALMQTVACSDHEKILEMLKKENFADAHKVLDEHISGAFEKIRVRMP